MKALRRFEDTHTIAGIWIRMVFCKIKLSDTWKITKYSPLACNAVQYCLVLFYRHFNFFLPEQAAHHMFLGFNTNVDGVCFLFECPH